MEIQLRGAAEAILARDTYVAGDTDSAGDVIRKLAAESPELERQLLRADGTPRQSARVLIDGRPTRSLDDRLPAGATVTVNPTLSCDG